jgi:hypothetical protein
VPGKLQTIRGERLLFDAEEFLADQWTRRRGSFGEDGSGASLSGSLRHLPLPFPRANNELATVVPPFAACGQIDDSRTAKYGYPVVSLPVSSWPARVRLRVKMVNGSRGWGVVSFTNNDMQLITTYRPE